MTGPFVTGGPGPQGPEKGRKKRPFGHTVINLAHGSGGKATHSLVESVFLDAFANPILAPLNDGAVVSVAGRPVAFTTDSLAACGAQPLALSAGFVIEEGFAVADLERVVGAMAAAANAAGVPIVTGDTKVVERGKGDGCYVNTSGIGLVDERAVSISGAAARPGDRVIVSGPIGDHGTAVMLARGTLGITAAIVSDTAALNGLVNVLLEAAGAAVHVLRDATRGGVATVLNEVAAASRVAVVLEETALPVRPEVVGVCELLGLDPLYVACEGRMVVVVAPEAVEAALGAMRAHPLGTGSVIIGEVVPEPAGLVLQNTGFGGARVVDMLVGDPLPRIC